ncbi:PadR family transcriptional regulator [Paractinoplanes atraurantiacus]|uniref:Transcriptional regulator PadR-like family protein n=1 Tax=Paractinoplanes atraurantiacus TaxID=1036182 RepID=A0A285J059_9ACTN|nr:PadR family transcriptional regulator [Actinoplanes atraurantiacus]SNY52726.1 Transcriptional regulator PadR-like family protein [Actinoplanes atraurantiacus]
MREPTYFILAALQEEPLHGYAIIKQTEALSRGRVKPATGTLYTALDRLTHEGLVQVVKEEVVNGRARRYYALTPDGLAALKAEAAHLAEAARIVTDRPVSGPSGRFAFRAASPFYAVPGHLVSSLRAAADRNNGRLA